MKIKARGESRRITISFTPTTYTMLRDQSEKLGYSLAEIARRVIDNAVVSDVGRVTNAEDRDHLYEKICRLHEKRIKGLEKRIKGVQDHLDIKDQLIAQMQLGLEQYTEVITEQASSIETLQDALRERDGPFVVRDVVQEVDD